MSARSVAADTAEAAAFPWTVLLGAWLLAGTLAILAFPALRGIDPWFGWLPFWLVLAPALDLVVLRRSRIAGALRAALGAILARRPRNRRLALPAARRRVTRGVAFAAERPQSLMPSRFLSIRRRNSPMMRRYRSSPR
jgi:hypothetical protein